MITYAGEGQM